jgi:hypothetical protein
MNERKEGIETNTKDTRQRTTKKSRDDGRKLSDEDDEFILDVKKGYSVEERKSMQKNISQSSRISKPNPFTQPVWTIMNMFSILLILIASVCGIYLADTIFETIEEG